MPSVPPMRVPSRRCRRGAAPERPLRIEASHAREIGNAQVVSAIDRFAYCVVIPTLTSVERLLVVDRGESIVDRLRWQYGPKP